MGDRTDNKSFVPGGYSGVDGVDFFSINKGYGKTEIKAISDPEGGKRAERDIPTAIPSPFARFDLVATAFKNIAATDDLRAGNSSSTSVIASKDDERLVSHTLDLAEIVFDREKYGNKLVISSFNCKEGLKQLIEKNLPIGYKRFLKSLDLYLEQDSINFNFGFMDDIFLFKYDNVVIGSTSPITFFCPTANNLLNPDSGDYSVIKLEDQRDAFSENFKPLYERSHEFQKWFHFLVEIFKAERSLPEGVIDALVEYTKENEEHLRRNKKEDLLSFIQERKRLGGEGNDRLEKNFQDTYAPLTTGGANTRVKVLKTELYVKKAEDIGKILQNSDFCIVSERYRNSPSRYAKTGNSMPLVLPNDFNQTGWKYATGEFKPRTTVPLYVDGTYDQPREMPELGMKGYFLTVSDFLEPYIIKTIYPISDKFYGGGAEKDKNPVDNGGCGYLLPLKKEFFDFFSREDLISGGNGAAGKQKITVVPQNDKDESVKVSLKIPVAKSGNQYITFEKTYKSGKLEQKDHNSSVGGIVIKKPFGLTIFPFIRPDKDLKKVFQKYGVRRDYMVQLVDSDKIEKAEYTLNFYSETNEKREPFAYHQRKYKGKTTASSVYYELQVDYKNENEEFEYIQISQKTNSGDYLKALIIPKWHDVAGGGDRYVFAVDFGTTNTHIMHTIGDDKRPLPFTVSGEGDDIQIATLFDEKKVMSEKQSQAERIILSESPDIIELIEKEFVPRVIGKQGGNIFVFPQRTAIAYSTNMTSKEWNDGDGLDALTESNISFGYEKIEQQGSVIETNLKWKTRGEDADKSDKKARSYLREIIMLIQNKVLANGGDLTKTKLMYFYPSSMTPDEKKQLRKMWTRYFDKYFGQIRNDDGTEDRATQEIGNRVVGVLESLAPYYAQRSGTPDKDGWVVSIDIGGGTTDVAIFKNQELKGTTSFKFAGNALFGDAYFERGQGAKENGFALRLVAPYKEKLEGFIVPKKILKELEDRECASDINAFLFSIENNIEHWATRVGKTAEKTSFSFADILELEGQDLKFLILYFYAALMYHIAQLLNGIAEQKGESINLKSVMFSGTASKILKVLTDNDGLAVLTKQIFKNLGLKSDGFTVKELASDPKELTCRGGLVLFGNQPEYKKVTTASERDNYVYNCIKSIVPVKYEDYYNDIDDKENGKIKKHLIDFHEFFFALNKDIEFKGHFGIETKVINFVKKNYEELINDWLVTGVELALELDNISRDKNKNDDDDNYVKETPFFMPLKAMMLRLSKDIAGKKYEE
jgi:hypothetical protein